MAASEQSSSLNVALADGQLSGNRDGRFGSTAAGRLLSIEAASSEHWPFGAVSFFCTGNLSQSNPLGK